MPKAKTNKTIEIRYLSGKTVLYKFYKTVMVYYRHIISIKFNKPPYTLN